MKFPFGPILLICFLGAPAAAQDAFHLYLIGDAGNGNVHEIAYKHILQQQIKNNAQVPSAIVFLGDNIYPKGMPDEDHRHRLESEQIMAGQVQLAGADVKKYFVPGNHDWQKGGKHGLTQLLNQQEWIDSIYRNEAFFLPRNGCPGPVTVKLADELMLVIIDSQWWLHPWDKPEGENSLCDQKTREELISELRDILLQHRDKQIVVAAHHPIYTYGDHGGHFSLKDHLFPLTDANKNLWLPLPVVGSIYPVYRKLIGNIQDTAHPEYKLFRQLVHEELSKYPGIIYAAGHEHALQYIVKDSIHYVVSGSGVKSTPVKKKGFAKFVSSENGFVRVSISKDGQQRIEYFGAGETPLYTTHWKRNVKTRPTNAIINSLPDSVEVAASNQYQAGRGQQRWFGTNYRAEWAEKIKVPVFDFKSPSGDPLKIEKRGGGMQTLSLRLEASNGDQYTLRSIEKYPEKAIPKNFRNTFAADIVQDQISAAHPYGALAIPVLAEAAGIYHTNPRLVYLADDPRLGLYQPDFGNQLMLFEERPDGKAKDKPYFGNASDILSTSDMLDELEDDNDNYVDQQFVLRSRLFDLLIGDWDRHDDQWRWAEFKKKGKSKMYRPIPRDRDQAFFVNEGILPYVWSRRWALPKFQGFDHEIDWTPGFMFNARYFDRSFLNEPSREDWIATARELQTLMTDKVIEQALNAWPPAIREIHGEEIASKLRNRRKDLIEYALQHYRFLSKEVDVTGSDKDELFEVTPAGPGTLKLAVHKISKKGEMERLMYQRIFRDDETREVRLYGLKGDDQFKMDAGSARIKVRMIGGGGEDEVNVKSGRGYVYDKPKGLKITGDHVVHNRSSTSKWVNHYDRKAFQYDRLAPLLFLNFNVDDGIFAGGGFLYTRHGFRKDPYHGNHLFLGSYAFNTSSFNFRYDGHFAQVFGRWGLELNADIKSPNYVNNFFGPGNESLFDKDIDENPAVNVDNAIQYYRLRFKEVLLDMRLERTFDNGFFVKAGPRFQTVELEAPEGTDRFIGAYDAMQPESLLEVSKVFAGGALSWGFSKVNHPSLTTRGVRFQMTSQAMDQVNGSGSFSSHAGTFALYQSFRLPARVTFAFRAGAGTTVGAPQLYQLQILDGKTELRGFRKTRFYGDSKLYFNHEVRIKLANLRSYIVPSSLGVSFFYDVGRVWYEDANGVDPSTSSGTSRLWHKGYGGGLWFTPFNLTVVSTDIGFSDEGWLAYVRLGFLF
ncbi:MAG: metallophosphoesterase [Cyclobacteriaceae bacterium]